MVCDYKFMMITNMKIQKQILPNGKCHIFCDCNCNCGWIFDILLNLFKLSSLHNVFLFELLMVTE